MTHTTLNIHKPYTHCVRNTQADKPRTIVKGGLSKQCCVVEAAAVATNSKTYQTSKMPVEENPHKAVPGTAVTRSCVAGTRARTFKVETSWPSTRQHTTNVNIIPPSTRTHLFPLLGLPPPQTLPQFGGCGPV